MCCLKMCLPGQYPLKSIVAIGTCDVRKTACVAAAIVRVKTQLPFLGTLLAEGICCVRDKLVKAVECQAGRETVLLFATATLCAVERHFQFLALHCAPGSRYGGWERTLEMT